LKGVRLITSDACIGLAESAAEFFLEAALAKMRRALVSQHLQPRAFDQGAGVRDRWNLRTFLFQQPTEWTLPMHYLYAGNERIISMLDWFPFAAARASESGR
jgi:hypothetical protein